MKKKRGQNGVKGFFIGLALIVLVLGYYLYLSNKKPEESQSEQVKISVAQEILMHDLEQSYPPSPREVLKYFCEIAQCLYGEDYTEEELLALAMQVQKLYDAELVANQTQDQYLTSLQLELSDRKEQEIVISSYSPSSSTDVEYYSQDGYDWAKLYCSFTLRKGTQLEMTNEVFLMRKDEDGHWKIYGWKKAEDAKQNGES